MLRSGFFALIHNGSTKGWNPTLLQAGWKKLSYFWSREGLASPFMLTCLLWINLLGTIYGYYWYGDQLALTVQEQPLWLVPFVPDSPTASLFFTAAIWWLYKVPERNRSGRGVRFIRGFVEAFALVTSVKYGVWAVSIIAAGAYQGNMLGWQDYMLSASHLGMAAEALLYVGFYRVGKGALALVAAWTLFNDYADYHYGIYPWLPQQLWDDLGAVQAYTVGLSLVCLILAWLTTQRGGKSTV